MLVKSGVYCLLCFTTFTISSYKCALYRRLITFFIGKHQSRGHFRSYSFRLQVEKRLGDFIREHTILCYQVVHGNRHLWSTMLLAFLATNLPSNIYLLIRLFLSGSGSSIGICNSKDTEFELVDTVAIGVIFAGQTAVVAVVLGILAQQSKTLHSFARYVPALQQILNAGNGNGSRNSGRASFKILSLKLKLDLLLERLTCGRPYGVSIGPLWTITYDTLIQVRMVLGWLFLTCKKRM